MRILLLALLNFISSYVVGYDPGKAYNREVLQVEDLKSSLNTDSMKVRITIGENIVTATMYYNSTTKDFISLLPLSLTLKDYAGTEKISDLPKKLSVKDAPSGSDPSAGDIAYYSPWGNLALFYRDSDYASGLVILGKIDSGIGVFNVPGIVNVKMEIIQ